MSTDLVLELIYNFTLSGYGTSHSVIVCSSPVRIILQYIDNFTIQDITLINCSHFSTISFNVSIYILYCSRIYLHNLYVNVTSNTPAGITGIHLMNVLSSSVTKVKVHVNILICHSHPVTVNGISIYYNGNNHVDVRRSPSVTIEEFDYQVQKSCLQYSYCAITIVPEHTFWFRVFILNMVFANLRDCSILRCYDRINREYDNATVYILIRNVTVMQSTAAGFRYLKMFLIVLNSFEFPRNISSSIKFQSVRFYNMLTINFYNCSFSRNSNMEAMIYVQPSTFSEITAYIVIENSTFHNNKDLHFLKVTREYGVLPSTITYVFLLNLIVSNNDHQNFGGDLILVTKGHVQLANNVFVGNYYKYKSLFTLLSSMLYFTLSNSFINNKARYIIKAQEGSIFFIQCFAAVSIVDNFAYKVVLQENTIGNSGVHICPIQAYDNEHSVQVDDLEGINCTFCC